MGRQYIKKFVELRSLFSHGLSLAKTTIFWSLVALTSVWMAIKMNYVLEGVEFIWLRIPMFLLFVSCFAWICVPFWIAVSGLFLLLFKIDPLTFEKQKPLKRGATKLSDRCALVMPVYNEPSEEVFGAIAAMYDNVNDSPDGKQFDFYILSDSQDPNIVTRESELWSELNKTGRKRLYYRRREKPYARKSGNIEDFVERWGAHYESMIVLDADSIMSADTIVALAKLMQANPQAGIIQTSPKVIFADSLFGRLIQFTARLYGPFFSYGAAFWHGASSNYWGHNAVIRIAAFRAHCGLGELPGEPPFGGAILSHDFVEAALLRSAGYGVYMEADLSGTYEQIPPTPIEYLQRDKRWSQGNLQHLKLLVRPQLTVSSRTFFVLGALAYISSPLWLLLLLFSTIDVVLDALLPHEYYYPNTYQLFPNWPISRQEDAIALFLTTVVVLFLPKLAALVMVLFSKSKRKSFGGAIRLIESVLIETLFFMLFAPTMMMFHSWFVLITLARKIVPWNPQNRSAKGVSFFDALKTTWWISLLAIIWAGILAATETNQLYWMGPILIGLLFSPLLIWVASSVPLGERTRDLGFFTIPEEHETPQLLQDVRRLSAELRSVHIKKPSLQSSVPEERHFDMPINPIFLKPKVPKHAEVNKGQTTL